MKSLGRRSMILWVAAIIAVIAVAMVLVIMSLRSSPTASSSNSVSGSNTGYFRVRVKNERSRTPLEGYTVSISAADCAQKPTQTKITDASGFVEFAVPPGRYCVLAVTAPHNTAYPKIPPPFPEGMVVSGVGTTVADIIAWPLEKWEKPDERSIDTARIFLEGMLIDLGLSAKIGQITPTTKTIKIPGINQTVVTKTLQGYSVSPAPTGENVSRYFAIRSFIPDPDNSGGTGSNGSSSLKSEFLTCVTYERAPASELFCANTQQ